MIFVILPIETAS